MTATNKSVADVNDEARKRHDTLKNTYDDFPVGTKVQVVCVAQDFSFFKGIETGVVTKNSKEYLGIIVTFDKPYDKYRPNFNFEPKDLIKRSEPMASKVFQLRTQLGKYGEGSVVVKDDQTWLIGADSYDHRGSIKEGEFALLLDFLEKTKLTTILESLEDEE